MENFAENWRRPFGGCSGRRPVAISFGANRGCRAVTGTSTRHGKVWTGSRRHSPPLGDFIRAQHDDVVPSAAARLKDVSLAYSFPSQVGMRWISDGYAFFGPRCRLTPVGKVNAVSFCADRDEASRIFRKAS